MGIIKNLAFRFIISMALANEIAQQFEAYEYFILIIVFVIMFALLTYMSKKF